MALSACSATKTVQQTGSCTDRVATNYSGPSERSYCTTVTSYPSGVVLDGDAFYKARIRTGVDPANGGLDAVSGDKAIRYAELEVLDAAGNRVQCGETDSAGHFSLTVPTGTANLTVRVNSRSNNVNKLRASVLNCPEESGVYSVSTTFVPSGPTTVTLRADVTGDSLGSAFNILDQLYNANEFLRNRVGNCGSVPAAECTPVTTSAPKVKAYWYKGFNPNNYFGSSSPVSFYIPGTSRLFILGGEAGVTATEDTDDFDNSVIIHEYGHFLEDIYSVTNSPGGSHSGNKFIDSRLAWSEGWGDFIQGAVQNSPYYVDTFGWSTNNAVDHNSYDQFNIPIELNSAAYNSFSTTNHCATTNTASGCDVPQTTGEGNFREFSVTRMLWDIADGGGGNTSTNGDSINNEFVSVWKSLTSATAFKDPLEEFRGIGLIHEYDTDELGEDWSSLRTTHKQGPTSEYAQYVERSSSSTVPCGTGYLFNLSPVSPGSDTGTFPTSNLAANNDFFFYKHPGGTFNLKLTYLTRDTGVAGYNTGLQTIAANNELESDIDLFLYNSSARYGNSADMKLIAQNYPDFDPATSQIEQASKSLPAGNYLINIKAYTGKNTSTSTVGPYAPNQYIDAGTILDYKIEINGEAVCPKAKPWK